MQCSTISRADAPSLKLKRCICVMWIYELSETGGVSPGSLDAMKDTAIGCDVTPGRYGMVYPGVGWVIWRTKEDLPEELVFKVAYLGEEQVQNPTNPRPDLRACR